MAFQPEMVTSPGVSAYAVLCTHYTFRMTDAQASEAARSLANARWRGHVISRAISTLAERRDELDAAQLADLRAIAEGRDGDDAR